MRSLYNSIAAVSLLLVVVASAVVVQCIDVPHDRCSRITNPKLCADQKECGWCGNSGCYNIKSKSCCGNYTTCSLASETCCQSEMPTPGAGTPVCCIKGSKCCAGVFPQCCGGPGQTPGVCCAGGAAGSVNCCKSPSVCPAGICCAETVKCGGGICCMGQCYNNMCMRPPA